MLLREATAADVPTLTAALLEAVNWDGEVRLTREQVLAEPELAHYVSGWPRPGDFGVVATDDSAEVRGGGEVLGAAWCRLFDAADPGYGYLADDIPELTIGVAPAHRGRGVGTALLTALIRQAHACEHTAISLSVEDGNRARVLYERAGFVTVGRNGGSDTMRLDLRQQPIPCGRAGRCHGDWSAACVPRSSSAAVVPAAVRTWFHRPQVWA